MRKHFIKLDAAMQKYLTSGTYQCGKYDNVCLLFVYCLSKMRKTKTLTAREIEKEKKEREGKRDREK